MERRPIIIIKLNTFFFSSFSLFVRLQLKDLATQQPTQRYADDPAYTEDVRHLALPQRRNSGPDSSRRKSCSILDNKIFDRVHDSHSKRNEMHSTLSSRRSTAGGGVGGGNYSYDKKTQSRSHDKKYVRNFRSEDSTSSDDSSGYDRRGQSLDRSIYKQQKKTLCFQREKESSQNRRMEKLYQRKAFSKENLLMESSPQDFGPHDYYVHENYPNEPQRLSRSKDRYNKHASSSTLPLGERKYSSLSRGEAHSFEQLDRPKSKENISKFQIGKRFLKGEIGIKSFNYYLLKEGLKSTKKSGSSGAKRYSTPHGISKSEENIYEEVFFTERKTPKKKAINNYPDCELCIQECMNKNCDICKASEQKHGQAAGKHSMGLMKPKTPFNEMRSFNENALENSGNGTNMAQTAANVLQYQSYNPNNPGIYKVETTPVAFTSEYNPIEEIYGTQKYAPQHMTVAQKISSSSSDSLQHHKYMKSAAAMKNNNNNYYDCSGNEMTYSGGGGVANNHYSGGGGGGVGVGNSSGNQLKPQIYKTDSKASILSEMSIKSENSTNRFYKPAEMSDSSLGDSLFSYPSQRRYYGSAESCRIGYECRRCSFDGDKCSFSDNCRYECRNCDCSSSYFSSDFDDGTFSRKGSARISNTSQMSYYDDSHTIDSKTTRYAEDFMKHLNNVKKSCNIPAMTVTHGSNTPQTERSQKVKSYMNSLPKMSNEHSTLPKTMKPYDNGANDEFRIRNLVGTLEQQPQSQQQVPPQPQPQIAKKPSSGASKSGGSSSSSKSDSATATTGANNKNGASKSTGTIPKSNIAKCNLNIIDEPTGSSKIDADVEPKNLNLIDGSASVELCIEDCDSCRKVADIGTESKIASADNDDDGNVDAITDDVFEADCRTECDPTKMSKKSVSKCGYIYMHRTFDTPVRWCIVNACLFVYL